MLDHVLASVKREWEEKHYRSYMADALWAISENVARIAGGHYVSKRWDELINPTTPDERSGDEIAADVIRRAGLTLKGEDING